MTRLSESIVTVEAEIEQAKCRVDELRYFRRLIYDAERKAAASLGITRDELLHRSLERWGRDYIAEREARLESSVAAMRTMQALRGHVARTMKAELADEQHDEDDDQYEDED